jgi:hypothetical protein
MMNHYLEPKRPMELRQVLTPVHPTFLELSLDPEARMRAPGGVGFMDSETPQVGPVMEVTSPDGGRLMMRLMPGSHGRPRGGSASALRPGR